MDKKTNKHRRYLQKEISVEFLKPFYLDPKKKNYESLIFLLGEDI